MAQTFSWENGRNNTHGTPTGTHPDNPFYCTTAGPNTQDAYPCDEADDQAWSHIIITSQSGSVNRISQAGQGGTQTTLPIASTTSYGYQSTVYTAQNCGDCSVGFYWGNENDGDYLDYYNTKFMGFKDVYVALPDGAQETHKYYTTEGLGVYDTAQVTSCPSNLPPIKTTCQKDPWWDLTNVAHGHEYEADYYDTNGTTLLKQATTGYTATCPPSGVSPTPPIGSITWDGKLVSSLDLDNPVAVCDVQATQSDDYMLDGGTNSTHLITTSVFDSYGRLTKTTESGNGGSPTQIIHTNAYITNDSLTLPTASRSNTPTTVTGTYIIDSQAFADTEDSSGARYACHYTSYDGQAYHTGQNSGLTKGLPSRDDTYTDCGNSGNSFTPSGQLSTTTTYDQWGNVVATDDADALAGVSGHTGDARRNQRLDEIVDLRHMVQWHGSANALHRDRRDTAHQWLDNGGITRFLRRLGPPGGNAQTRPQWPGCRGLCILRCIGSSDLRK